MITGSGLQVRLSQQFSCCIGDLTCGRIGILTTANREFHCTRDGNRDGHVAIAMAVTTMCTTEGNTCGQCRTVEACCHHLLVGNLETNEVGSRNSLAHSQQCQDETDKMSYVLVYHKCFVLSGFILTKKIAYNGFMLQR